MRISIKQRQALHPFNLLVFILSVYVIIALLVDAFTRLSHETSKLLHDIDHAICVIFFVDFLVRFFSAKNKWRYMRWGWIDLISSIPVFDFLLAARLFRVIQLLRVLRAFRSMSIITKYYFSNKIRGTFTSVG